MPKAISEAEERRRHEAKLASRRARRERKKAAKEEEAQDAMQAAAASQPSESSVNQVMLVGHAHIRGSKSPRRMTEARENLSIAFEDMGGIPALVAWGKRNPTEFYRIWARLIPKELPQDPAEKLPLETLLAKLTERAEMSVQEAAVEIGQETLDAAAQVINVEDAVAAFNAGESA